MKKILSFIIVIFMFLLVGCGNRYEMLTNELNKIKEDPEYIFLGRAGITKNNVAYSFVEEIEKAVKESKRKLFSEAGYLEGYIYDNNRIYFLYKYYWSGDKEKDFDKTTRDFCFGYFDVLKQELTMLEYFEKLSNDEGCNLVKVYGNIVYIRLGDKVIEYNIDVKRVTNEYKSTLVSYQESTTDTFMIKDTYTYTLFTKNNKYVFDLTDDYTTYFIKDNIILFSKYDNSLKQRIYAGYNINTKESISTEEVNNIVNLIGKNKEQTYLLNDEEYYIDVDEERIKFQKVNEEDYFILTIEDVKNSNDDYKKITEIFDKEGFFNSILYKNNKLYIIIRNNSSFFGIYDGAIPPLVFEYNIQTKELEYLGYYTFVYYDIIDIIHE